MNPQDAFELEQGVLAARSIQVKTWVLLAERLSEFHASKAWDALGWDDFSEWLGSPEVAVGKRTAYRLIQAWRWAIENDVPPASLELVDVTKLSVILPAARRGDVSTQEALYDAVSLSRSDLIAKYVESRENGGEPVQTPRSPEVEELRAALVECATIAGADVSGGVPSFPDVQTWAIEEVTALRKQLDELTECPDCGRLCDP